MNLVGTTRGCRHRAADGAARYERRDHTAAPFDYLNCGSWANASRQLRETEAAARSLGVRLKVLRVPSTTEFDKTFSGMGRASATALFISSDGLFLAERRRIADIALANRMPAIGFAREFAEDGILMAYGSSLPALYHRAAVYVDKILKGAKPADLPVEQPTKFELVINLKTAKALGITIPPHLLMLADEVLQ